MRWTVALFAGFVTMLVANGLLVYFAVAFDDPVVSSYVTEKR